MSHIATLIGHRDLGGAAASLIDKVVKALPQASRTQWLDEGLVADVGFVMDGSLADTRAMLAEIIRDARMDVVVQPMNGLRRKQLLIADMDSTMIGQECIDELADFAGVKAHVAAITEQAMRGDIAFEPALRARVALLKGMSVAIVDEVIEKRITLTAGARHLVATMKAHGAYAALISGGFTLFTKPIAARIGFDHHQANRLIVKHGRFTGEVAEPILGRVAKRQALEQLIAERQLDQRLTMAVGDGANDLDMLAASGLGIAYHAKPAVAEAAHANILHTDLTALLFAQGYHKLEFVGATSSLI